MPITLKEPSSVTGRWLQQVYGCYVHELTRFDPDLYHLGVDGVWQPDYLPYWLGGAPYHPLVIHDGDEPAGFVFVATPPAPFLSPGVEYRLCEFFVLNAFRRHGVGAAAASEVFKRFRGTFELLVLERNTPALTFWRSVIAGRGSFAESLDEDGAVKFSFST